MTTIEIEIYNNAVIVYETDSSTISNYKAIRIDPSLKDKVTEMIYKFRDNELNTNNMLNKTFTYSIITCKMNYTFLEDYLDV